MKALLGAAALAVACSIGAADAQEPNPAASTHNPAGQDRLEWIVKHVNVKPGTRTTGAVSWKNNEPAPLGPGWYYGDASYCGYFNPDQKAQNQWFYMFLTQGGQNIYTVYEINNLYFAQGVSPPCAVGNYFGFHVFDNSGHIDKTQSYPYQ